MEHLWDWGVRWGKGSPSLMSSGTLGSRGRHCGLEAALLDGSWSQNQFGRPLSPLVGCQRRSPGKWHIRSEPGLTSVFPLEDRDGAAWASACSMGQRSTWDGVWGGGREPAAPLAAAPDSLLPGCGTHQGPHLHLLCLLPGPLLLGLHLPGLGVYRCPPWGLGLGPAQATVILDEGLAIYIAHSKGQAPTGPGSGSGENGSLWRHGSHSQAPSYD